MIKTDHREQRGSAVTYLEPALWRQLSEAETENDFCMGWLHLQCRMIEGAMCGTVVSGPAATGPFKAVAIWPEGAKDLQQLTEVANQVLQEKKGVVISGEGNSKEAAASSQPQDQYIGFPIKVGEEVLGVAALKLTARPHVELQLAMRQLQWGISWLDKWALRRKGHEDVQVRKRLALALDLTAIVIQKEKFKEAASSFVTELATRLECDRVSLGFVSRNQSKIKAISHSAQFGKQMNLIRAIENAMDESIDQGKTILFPDPDEGRDLILREHIHLAKEHGSGTILTIPFQDEQSEGYGAITIERPGDNPFDENTIHLFNALASLAGPLLNEKYKRDRPIYQKTWDGFVGQLQNLMGPEHLLIKSIAAAVCVIAIVLCFAKGDYRVTAKTTLRGTVQRAVTAPFNGYLIDAPVRAGDVVVKGQLLAKIDDRDISVERFKYASEYDQHMFEYHKAMADGDIANSKISVQLAKQAEAQIQLLDEQLKRTRITSPLDGLVVSGDHSQTLGMPIEQGKVLYEVAPLDSYRVVLEVDEWEIDQIRDGQHGELILSAFPDDPQEFEVNKITPVTESREGKTFFQVEAHLLTSSPRLRPGMVGYGKIKVDRRLLAWIWSHDLIDWLRLRLWTFFP